MQTKLGKYHVVVIGILVFWYVALFPGRIGYDYVLLARMIRAGESTGWWGATYFWFYKLLTFDAQVIYVISLVGLLALFHAIRFFVYSLPINVRFQKRVLLVVISTPLFGVFGVTVSHDVFQSAGVILLVSLALRIRREAITDSQVMFTLFLAGLYLTSTQIGLIIFFVFSIPLVLKKKYWVIVLAVSMFCLSLIASLGIDNKGWASEFVPATIRNLILIDLKCIVQHPDVSLKSEEWLTLERYAAKSSWLQQTSCSNPDVLAAPLSLEKLKVPADRELFKLFIKLVTQEPSIPIMSHIQRSRVALPPPFFQPPSNQVSLDVDFPIGQGTNTALQNGPGILHPSIDDKVYDIRFRVLKPLEAIALLPAFLMNQASWFWSWGGLWLWPILIFFTRNINLRRWNDLLPVISPILTLHLLLFFVGPSSLGRYVMSTIYMGFILTYIQITSYLKEEGL